MKVRRSFENEPASVREARRFVAEQTAFLGPEDAEAVALMVSELAANCVRHAQSAYEVEVTRSGADLRVGVTDNGGGRPQMGDPAPTVPSGRGLRIVDMLSSRWGVDDVEGGSKTVWFCLSLESPTDSEADETEGGSDRDRRPGPVTVDAAPSSARPAPRRGTGKPAGRHGPASSGRSRAWADRCPRRRRRPLVARRR